MAAIERGEYYFLLLSPERLQSPEFRQALVALAQGSFINLAVIDEAHCVSEWGYEFRPSYLHLGSNLRDFCRDQNNDPPPPILAMTGTASQAVLRDMLVDLEIATDNSDALIRQDTFFDRKEISFKFRKVRPGEESAALKGLMNAIPKDFGIPKEGFLC